MAWRGSEIGCCGSRTAVKACLRRGQVGDLQRSQALVIGENCLQLRVRIAPDLGLGRLEGGEGGFRQLGVGLGERRDKPDECLGALPQVRLRF